MQFSCGQGYGCCSSFICVSSAFRDVAEKEQIVPCDKTFEGHLNRLSLVRFSCGDFKRGSGCCGCSKGAPGQESSEWLIQLFMFGSFFPHTSH